MTSHNVILLLPLRDGSIPHSMNMTGLGAHFAQWNMAEEMLVNP